MSFSKKIQNGIGKHILRLIVIHPNLIIEEENCDNNRENQEDEGNDDIPTVNNDIQASEGRQRPQPAWTKDCILGSDLSYEEIHMALVFASTDPYLYEEAVKEARLRDAVDKKVDDITKNKIWTLTQLPGGARKIRVKWIFKTKFNDMMRETSIKPG